MIHLDLYYAGSGSGLPPAVPGGLAVTTTSATELHVAWSASPGATSYSLRRSTDHSTWTTLAPGAATSYDDTGLTAATTYYYEVDATSAAGTSAWSAEAAGTTDASAAFDPTSVTSAALTQWLRADLGTFQDAAGTTPAVAASAPVQLWRDQGGAGNHQLALNATWSATLHLNVLNGHPVLGFDGAHQAMETAGTFHSQTMFVVLNHTNGATFTAYQRVLDAGDTLGWSLVGSPDDAPFTLYTPTATLVRGVTAPHTRVNGVVTNQAAPLASYRLLYAQATAQANRKVDLGTLAASGVQLLQGNVAEVVIYDGPLSAPDLAALETYFNTRYALW